jgi:hypothetical protein
MIDPFAKTIREHLTPKALDRDLFRAEIGCEWVQRVKLTDQVEMWLDESGAGPSFTFHGYGMTHAGRAIVCGVSMMGDCISAPSSFHSVLERHVLWLGAEAGPVELAEAI